MKAKLLILISFILGFSSTFAVNFSSKVDSKWNNGYCYKFYIGNNESKPITDWKILFDMGNSTLKSKRNGVFTCSNGKCEVTSVSWNKKIKVGKKFEIGFCANGTDLPSNVKFVGDNNTSTTQSDSTQTFQTTTSQTLTPSSSKSSQASSIVTSQSKKPEVAKDYTVKKDGFVVEVKKQSDWGNGFCRQIILKNTNTDKKVTYWKLQFELNQKLSDSWNAKFSKSSKGIYKVYPKDYNKQIQPNSNISIGFCSNGQLRDKNWEISKVKFTTVSSSINNSSTSTDVNSSDQHTIQVHQVDLSTYKYIIPAYWWSYDLNKKLLDLPIKSSIVIINPSNGDFNKTEEVFVDEINKTHQKSNLAIGYIYSKYGNRDLSVVKQEIDNWLKYYPSVNGFFIDEVSSSSDKLAYYKDLYNYIKSKNPNLIVVLNPGTTPDKGYFDIADNIVAYENSCKNFDSYEQPNWIKKYGKKVSYLGYNCSTADYNKYVKEFKNNLIYFTEDGSDGNPWDSLSKYVLETNNANNTTNQQTSNQTDSSNSNFKITIKPEGKLVGQYSQNKWATYKANDKILEINPWNIASTDGDAKMYYDDAKGVATYIQDFYNIKQQNPGGYVLGYPEVYVGNKPWNGNYVDAGSKLPAKLDELKSLKVEASWKYEHPSNLSCNFAMEGWLTKSKFQKTGVGNGEVEMMIMWYRNIQGAAGGKVGQVTIPVEVNGKTENVTFDIYKANIGWDFVTFIPHNYKDFKNASIKFDILDFTKAAEKYVPQIKNLYLEDWEFGTEYGTPSTKTAKLAWQITKFKVIGDKGDTNNNGEDNNDNGNDKGNGAEENGNNDEDTLAPYSFEKFQKALKQCKLTYPDSHKKVVDKGQFEGFKTDYFYATKNGDLVFKLKKPAGESDKLRNELRQQQNQKDSGWRIDEDKIHTLTAKIKLQKLNKALEYTFLQIHSEVNPLLRMVVEKEKNGKQNHIWAVVRINTNNSGKRTNRYDLGEVSDNYNDFKIQIGNNNLKIYKNGKLYVNKNISYWPEVKNYFKAGIYDSKNSKGPWEVKIMFNELKMFEANDSGNSNNNISLNIKNTSFYFAPYVDATLYPFPQIADIAKKTGNKNYILAFIVSKAGKCEASWGGYYDVNKGPSVWINGKEKFLYDDVSILKNQGGKIMISFGGASGTPLFAACTNEDDLVNQYSKVIDKLKIYDLDFDVEGAILNNKTALQRLVKALVKLQTKYNNKLNIYFTLPVMPEGLTLDGTNFVEQVIKNNLLYAGINLMTMDYGSSYNKDMGDYAIQAVNSVVNQLKSIYSKYGISVSNQQMKHILGITPMIGLNDITTENFTLEDAKQVGLYTKNNELNRLNYWSLNRDHSCSKNTVDLKCSSKNNQNKDYEYMFTFMLALGLNSLISTNTTDTVPPYNFDKFKHALFNSELTYPTSKDVVIDKGQFEDYKSDFFYATKDGVMYFVLPKKDSDNEKLRVELREQQNHQNSGWPKDTSEVHYLKAVVKLQPIQNSNIPEYTFIQIQEKEYYKPLLRLVVRYSKNGETNHIWAVIRNTTGYDGKISDRVDLGPVMDDVFDNYKILVGNNRLDIYRNGTLVVDRDISYWTPEHNYFKAGIYDSGNGKSPFEIKIGFNQFDWGVLQNNDSESKNDVYQVKTSNIQQTQAENYYQVSKNEVSNYDKLIPETYKNQVDNVFEKLTHLYTGDVLKQKLETISARVNTLINQYSSDSKILPILLYIKQKTGNLLSDNSTTSNSSNLSTVDYFVKGTEIYKKVGDKVEKINLFGVNWFGFETPNYTVHGLWSRNYKDMLKQIKSLGFNAIRLPFCAKIVDNPTPSGIDYYKNPDLKGLRALDVMKKIVEEADKQGIYVLLDFHRIGCNYIEPMRKTKDFTEQDYINVWKKMAQIFSKYPNVIGADLKNEPHSEGQGDSLYQNGSTWGYNPETDWNLAAERIGKAVLSVAPNWLIFVEGTQVTNPKTDKSYKWGMNAWWGGNLMAVKQYPVNLPADKLVYSPHVYGPDVYNQPYFNESDFPNNMPDIWYHHFGYVKSDLNHPVIFGEFGGKYGEGDPKDKIWQQKLVDWMIKNNYCSFFYWSWNPNSGDTGGILKDDWTSINEGKYENLKRLMDYCTKY